MTKGNPDVSKADLLLSLGYAGDMEIFELILEDAGVSRPSKKRISTKKIETAKKLLAEFVLLVCDRGDCRTEAGVVKGERFVARAAKQHFCQICGGSSNQRAVRKMIQACRNVGWSQVCVVGGSPSSRKALAGFVGSDINLRLVHGTKRRNRTQARADIAWADVVVIWGSTELDHHVSNLYKGSNVTAANQRSVAAVAQAVATAASREQTKGG